MAECGVAELADTSAESELIGVFPTVGTVDVTATVFAGVVAVLDCFPKRMSAMMSIDAVMASATIKATSRELRLSSDELNSCPAPGGSAEATVAAGAQVGTSDAASEKHLRILWLPKLGPAPTACVRKKRHGLERNVREPRSVSTPSSYDEDAEWPVPFDEPSDAMNRSTAWASFERTSAGSGPKLAAKPLAASA